LREEVRQLKGAGAASAESRNPQTNMDV
jgi:hypothetical protein